MRNSAAILKKLTRFEIAAFITGFALLAYELTAARILAPSIGSSTYVWTSVIGVIIAALSLGYAAGGYVADKRVRQTDIAWLMLLATAGVITTLAASDLVLAAVSESVRDPRLQGTLVAAILFSGTSFLIGMISPYLARLRTVSVETTGSTVAGLNAANALGSIIGTFSVGFIFFGYVGSREALVITAMILFLGSFLFAPFERIIKRGGVGMLLSLAVLVTFPQYKTQGEVADIDTASARYKVQDVTYNDAPTRILVSGPAAAQSGVRLDGSDELVFHYTQQMANLVDQWPEKDRILVLGGGAFTLPKYLAKKYPESQIDVAEIDPKLPQISKDYFGYKDMPNVDIYSEDARSFLNRNKTKYGLILVDVYSDNSIPFSVTTAEYAERIKASLEPDGAVIANIIGSDSPDCRPMLRALHRSYSDRFKFFKIYPQEELTLKEFQNIVFIYTDQPVDTASGIQHDLTGGMKLTDNFAPVERLKLECQLSR